VKPILPDLITYALGILAGWWIFGRWGAGLAALFFCVSRIYSSLPERGRE